MADKRAQRLERVTEGLRVRPGTKVVLEKDHDPAFTPGGMKKKDSEEHLRITVELLAEYQPRLAAQDRRGILMILQGIDAAGKDGAIRHVMSGVNPQGVTVRSFKEPSAEELGHDFLWRYGRRLPGHGQIGIFNRSHYEEVLVVRVHPEWLARQGLAPASSKGGVWKRRFREINDWERHLVDNGIEVVKLFLNISREEQRLRFLERIDRAEKNWKFSASDVNERRQWDQYQHAFSEMLTHTSTPHAPWYVIPADHKWFARIAVGAVLALALIEIDPRYPTVGSRAREALQEAKLQLEAEAPVGALADPALSARPG